MKRITEQESKQFIPLKENYNDTSVSAASTFTITPQIEERVGKMLHILHLEKEIYSQVKGMEINGFIFYQILPNPEFIR
jgi:hypothetical protein